MKQKLDYISDDFLMFFNSLTGILKLVVFLSFSLSKLAFVIFHVARLPLFFQADYTGKKNLLIKSCLKKQGNIGIDNRLGDYYRNTPLAALPHASRLTHWQTRP